MNIFNNRIIYKQNSNIFSVGVFNSFDGSGLEVGFRYGGVHLKLPFFMWRSELDLQELTEKRLLTSLVEFTFWGIVSVGINFMCKFIISKFAKFQKLKMKRLVNESILEKRENIVRMKDDFLKTMEIISKTAEKYHLIELDKNEKGLIIHLALYGKFEKLERYKKDFDYLSNKLKNAKSKNINTNTEEFSISMKIKDYKIDEECNNNIENETIDVTLPVRNKISSNTQNTYSSVFFREPTKTSVFGFFNPIFKTEDLPYILIMYIIILTFLNMILNHVCYIYKIKFLNLEKILIFKIFQDTRFKEKLKCS